MQSFEMRLKRCWDDMNSVSKKFILYRRPFYPNYKTLKLPFKLQTLSMTRTFLLKEISEQAILHHTNPHQFSPKSNPSKHINTSSNPTKPKPKHSRFTSCQLNYQQQSATHEVLILHFWWQWSVRMDLQGRTIFLIQRNSTWRPSASCFISSRRGSITMA